MYITNEHRDRFIILECVMDIYGLLSNSKKYLAITIKRKSSPNLDYDDINNIHEFTI